MTLEEHRARAERWADSYLAGQQVWDLARQDGASMSTVYSALTRVLGPTAKRYGYGIQRGPRKPWEADSGVAPPLPR